MSRYLRIAAAVVLATLGVAFMALWVRSYWWLDGASGPIGRRHVLGIEHRRGFVVGTLTHRRHFPTANEWSRICLHHTTAIFKADPLPPRGFYVEVLPYDGYDFSLPYWFLVASSFALAALFAFKRHWRFTVRGLLLATSVIAAMLGLVVYAV
jgi:hypothetical protein